MEEARTGKAHDGLLDRARALPGGTKKKIVAWATAAVMAVVLYIWISYFIR